MFNRNTADFIRDNRIQIDWVDGPLIDREGCRCVARIVTDTLLLVDFNYPAKLCADVIGDACAKIAERHPQSLPQRRHQPTN